MLCAEISTPKNPIPGFNIPVLRTLPFSQGESWLQRFWVLRTCIYSWGIGIFAWLSGDFLGSFQREGFKVVNDFKALTLKMPSPA